MFIACDICSCIMLWWGYLSHESHYVKKIMYWYNWFSWWWALGCSKHV